MKNMELQDTAVIVATDTTRTKKYSSSIRLWHWSNAIIIIGSLLTVLINSTVLKPWENAGLIA
jgi:Ni/Fe-hydrogenase 1 B-type cytochrome subunit